jgi:hypothetical protein
MLCFLLLIVDLSDAYEMGDGNRIMMDMKMVFLYFF